MEKSGNPSSSNNPEDKSKKYKFYRKPSIKKKGPEVKQTKTSLARLLKANPLLKFEIDTKHEPPSITKDIKLEPVKKEPPKMQIHSGNRLYNFKSRISDFNRQRISSSDFAEPILPSSSFIESDDVFIENSRAPFKYLPKISSKEVRLSNNNILMDKKHDKRKSLSSQYLNKKKKELQQMPRKQSICTDFKNQIKSLRRSLSADGFNNKGCYKIEEEHSVITEAKSMQNLSQQKIPDEIVPTSTVLTAIALEDLENRPDKLLMKPIIGPRNGEVYDDENKENIEAEILESDSYEDLKIPNGLDLK